MNRYLLRSLALACAVTLPLVAAAPMAASKPTPFTITSFTTRGCPTPSSCTFVATGAIEDWGSATAVPLVIGGGASPVVGTAQWLKTYVGQNGSITIRLESRVTADGDSLVLPETGTWTIVSGTGAYVGILGFGSESGLRDYGAETLEATLIGNVH